MDAGGELACADRPLCLLPRTLFAKQDAIVAFAASEEEELDAIQAFLKSATLGSSPKLIEAAKAICNNTGDPLKLHCEGVDVAAVANTKEPPQGRRPGLGQKRAHFSFKPNVSDLLSDLELEKLNCIEDPEEVFREFENIECAEKEPKQLGGEVASDSSMNPQWATRAKGCTGLLDYETLSSSPKLIEAAKAVCNSTGDPLKLHCEDVDVAAVANTREPPKERRPGLGRKRAHFSFKPNVSDLLSDSELEKLDRIGDPEELFREFEKIERAKKELKKLGGEVASDLSPNPHWATRAKRRPCLLGRKVRYKHRYPEHIDGADALVPFQGGNQNFGPSKGINDANFSTVSQPMSQPGMSPEIETNETDLFHTSNREGFVDNKEKEADNLLDTLLHRFEYVKEGAEIDFLQDVLQIRSTNVDELCFPPLERVQLNDATTMVSKLAAEKLDGSQQICVSSTATSSPIAAISALGTLVSQTLKDYFSLSPSSEESTPENSLPGEGSSKSATSDRLAAIAALGRRISETDPLKDQFATHSSNEKSTPPNSLPDEGSSKNAFSLPVFSDHLNMVGTVIVNASGLDHPAKVDDRLLGVSIAKEAGHDKVNDVQEVPASGGKDQSSINAATDTPVCGSCENSSILPDWISEVNDVQEAAAACGEDQSSNDASMDIPMGGRSGNAGVLPDANDEGKQADLTASRNRPVEQEAPGKRQNKKRNLQRQSLAGAGMAWESGLRRSTRHRMKPLEYWRGERLLYARIHNSLPTVVGVKCLSGEKPGWTVTSYVPEEYKDLVEKVALH